MDADALFQGRDHRVFPVCTQVTLLHGVCDSYCVSCPLGRARYGDASPEAAAEFVSGARRFMSFELFQRVADEVAGYAHAWLRLPARGEPLLHPRFIDMVAYAKRAGVRLVQTFTDAITLDEAMAHAILEAGLDVLECSVHGHTQSYERLMRNGKYRRVVENVIRFRRLRDRRGGTTKLVVSAVDQPGLQPEKQAHAAFWEAYADQVIYRPYHSWGNRIEGLCAALPVERRACAQLWTRCTVGPTGKVLACFNSWSEPEEEVLGDLADSQSSIAAIWQSEPARNIRQGHLDGSRYLPCCAECRDWGGSAWGRGSYEHLLSAKLRFGEADDAC